MKAIFSFSALVILSYSCNNTAPKTDTANPVDTNQLVTADTLLISKDTLTQTVPPPPPRVQEFVVPEIALMEDEIPPPPNLEFSKIIDSRNLGMEENVYAIGPEDIYDNPEERPEFKPADQLTSFISDNLIYPQEALDQGITGIVKMSFVVEIDGSISKVAILKSSGHALLDYEAKRVIKKMPKWSPGKMYGMAVRCRYTLPIHFELTE
jgi:protein TonB